ncbi:MAG: TlpA family protein disulfide reductase [Woeseiaceae bacterium]|nr:TlpA family protein disulfide reductase [Woeseiaceae bacterium]
MKYGLAGLLSTLLLGIGAQAQAIEYRLPDLDGRMQSLDQYQGKWVVVNYWATWCGTCRKELPELASLHEKHRNQDIVVVGINFESISPQNLKDFVAEQKIAYPVLRSEPVRRTPLGPVPALPTTYLINPDGKIVAGEVGRVTRQDLEDYIAAHRDR